MSIIIQPGPNTATYPEAVTSADAIKPWVAGAAAADALLRSNQAYDHYLHEEFASWVVNYQAAKAEEPPPPVRMGFVAQIAEDGLSWDLIPSTTPSGPVPAYQKRPEAAASPVGFGQNPFSAMSSRSLLVAKIGQRATQSDGTVWLRLS